MLFFSRLILTSILAFILAGCGALRTLDRSTYQNEKHHTLSCGPEAIYDALQSLREAGFKIKRASKEEISREVRSDNKCSTITRGTLALFVYEAKAITFPCEITNYFKKRVINVNKARSFDELKSKDIAVVLVHQKGTLHYHWKSYPSNNNILRFFGKDTVIKTVYLLEK